MSGRLCNTAMLPSLAGLNQDRRNKGVPNTTGEFYALTPQEARALNANDGQEPISLDPYLIAQGRNSDYATFRVRAFDSSNKWIDKFYYAEGLWEWVRRPNEEDPPMATLPDRQYVWREDWWALSDRFAPGVPYPRWVRNLPQLDPSKDDTKTYAPHAPPDDEEDAEGHNLADDLNTFDASMNLLRDIPAVDHMHAVAANVRALIRGMDRANSLAEFHSAANDAAYQDTAREMYALLTMTPTLTSGVIALLELKAVVLEFMYKALSRRTLRESFPSLITHVDFYLQRITALASDNNPFSENVSVRAIYNAAFLAAHYVKHFYYWDQFIQPTLVRPPQWTTERPSWSRPLNGPEQLGLGQLMNAITGVAEMGTALLRDGGYQFFDTGDDVRFIEALRDTGTMFLAAHNFWPASGVVRSLAIRFFVLVLSLTPILKEFRRLALTADAAAKPVRVTAALHRTLANAVLASDYEYSVEGDNPNTVKLNAFFWRYVSRHYTEGAWTREQRSNVENHLNEIMDEWTEGTEGTRADPSEDEEEDADPVPDDTPMEDEEEEEGESDEEEDYNAEHNRDYEAMVIGSSLSTRGPGFFPNAMS